MTNPYLASNVKRAYGILSRFFSGFVDYVNGCWRGNSDRNGIRTAVAILNCSCVRPCGVTHSNPYLTVGPGRNEAGRDSGTNGNIAALACATP
jgi:hypothetical protein